MASRAQRRAQRRQQEARNANTGGGSQSISGRAQSRQAQVRPAQQQTRGQTGRREVPRGSFIRECIAELRKVEWPDQRQVTTGTVVVIIACAITGAYLWIADLIFKPFVLDILLTTLFLR